MENLFESVAALQKRLHEAGISSAVIGGIAVGVWGEPRVTRDVYLVEGIIRRQGDNLDDAYVLDWLRQFEQALDDSTLVAEYKRLRAR